jgi:acyl-coenzyme A synthetase/AMP-(fatty) acid ligase
VVGIDDERKGEIPACAVILRAGHTLTADELVTWASERLSDYKVPQRVIFVDAFPRTGTDKVQKAELKKQFAEAVS